MTGRARRGLLAAMLCAGFVLTLPGVVGHLTALVEGVLFDTAAAGGANTTFTSSFSSSTSVTEETVEVDAHRTRVTAVRDGTVVFDQTVAAPPDAPAVQALAAQAAAALAGPDCISTPLTVVESTRTPTGSSTAESVIDTDETVTVELTVGPDTILIGDLDAGGTPFVVPIGSQNFNDHTNTHTEILRTTTNAFLNSQHSQASGACAGVGPPPDAAPDVAEAPAAPAPVVATPRTAG